MGVPLYENYIQVLKIRVTAALAVQINFRLLVWRYRELYKNKCSESDECSNNLFGKKLRDKMDSNIQRRRETVRIDETKVKTVRTVRTHVAKRMTCRICGFARMLLAGWTRSHMRSSSEDCVAGGWLTRSEVNDMVSSRKEQ